MKLLFDENLSPNLPFRLADPIVWDYAKSNNLMIVSVIQLYTFMSARA